MCLDYGEEKRIEKLHTFTSLIFLLNSGRLQIIELQYQPRIFQLCGCITKKIK